MENTVLTPAGQTSWTAPDGVFILPRQAGGEWWELTDLSRDDRSYYYNTLSMMTQWTRPRDQALIIPLASIQVRCPRLAVWSRLILADRQEDHEGRLRPRPALARPKQPTIPAARKWQDSRVVCSYSLANGCAQTKLLWVKAMHAFIAVLAASLLREDCLP